MRICAVIVAGGRSLRMGRVKAFEVIRGRSMIDRIVAILARQAQDVVLNVSGDMERFAGSDLLQIPDLRRDIGTPLAGVHAALGHARSAGFDAVLTVPSDAPFLPADLVPRLAGQNGKAAIAASGGQQHYLTGLWSRDLLPEIEQAVAAPRTPRLQDWCGMCNATVVEWPSTPYDPFFNVNTPEDLAEAERIAAEFGL